MVFSYQFCSNLQNPVINPLLLIAKCNIMIKRLYSFSSWFQYQDYRDLSQALQNIIIPLFQIFPKISILFGWYLKIILGLMPELLLSTCSFQFLLYCSTHSVICGICSSLIISPFLLQSKRVPLMKCTSATSNTVKHSKIFHCIQKIFVMCGESSEITEFCVTTAMKHQGLACCMQ